ncbi:sensor histidine kinase [Brachybacterium sacelli]|uniref:Signal transduction histidine kinase n=1 Tax=Brachybacterium sacelli TaxID=173364 RepID=A0ABS4X2T1_9MICO|nr:histidine kinase [Brachybacterium sacelli]MBP2382059.1 signal transduction histidine kinase [Brachybacterium sacelli]
MRRLGTEGWAGVAMMIVAVAVSLPVLLWDVPLRIPRPLWALVLVVALAAVVAVGVLSARRRASRAVLATAVVTVWVLVLTVPAMGLLHVLVVITAAVSVYVVPLSVSLAIAGTNTVVVLINNSLVSADSSEVLILTGFYLLIQLATIFSTATMLRERRMRTELARAHVDLQAAGILLEESARTAERLRISRDLHDLIGHQLTVLTLNLEAARHLGAGPGEEHVERADQVARTLLRDVRSTVDTLRDKGSDLETALTRMVDGVPGLAVEITVEEGLELDQERALALVRLAQEALTNTIRHAQAEHLSIDVSRRDGAVELRAADDGVGAREVRLGNGLRGLRERFEGLGGGVDVEGHEGFRVTGHLEAA